MKFQRAYIEITNVCGLACSFCPPKDQPTQTMSLFFFESILLQLQEHTRDIALHVMGDPMVLSNLDNYLDVAHRLGFSVMITTSGFYLDEPRRAMLFHPCIKQVNVSLNSFNKNSVSRSFEAYMENILAFCDEKLNQPLEFFINLRLWNLDEACSEEAFNEQLFTLLEKHFALEAGFVRVSISGERQSLRVASKILLHFDRYFQWPSLQNEISGNGYCHGLSKQIAILADGRVVPCCLDGEGVIELGNLHVTNLGKILISERASTMLSGFKDGHAVEELCQKCSYKERFEKGVL
ncbi:MAG: radical SAM protein [Sulfuricurvum sp.]|nr:radical SAM protein [Sulfuricurvum sp.]